MKKWMIAVCALVLTVTMIATPAIAARANACRGNAGCANKAEEKNCSGNYVDADEDGICDNKDSNFVDADADGVCDNRREKQAGCQGNRCGRNGEGRGKQAGKNK